jgi:hypothetical protein
MASSPPAKRSARLPRLGGRGGSNCGACTGESASHERESGTAQTVDGRA